MPEQTETVRTIYRLFMDHCPAAYELRYTYATRQGLQKSFTVDFLQKKMKANGVRRHITSRRTAIRQLSSRTNGIWYNQKCVKVLFINVGIKYTIVWYMVPIQAMNPNLYW